MTAPMPRVGVIAHEAVPGIYSLAEVRANPRAMEVLPLDEALRKHWITGALVTSYTVAGERLWPRLNKRGTVATELEKGGSPVRSVLFCFDYDRPKVGGVKSPWVARSEVNDVLAKLRSAPIPTAFYVTRHGLRLVYALAEPLPPIQAERFYCGMLRFFKEKCGVEFDPQCFNWDRLIRLPYITLPGPSPEESVRTWEVPVVADSLMIFPDQRLDVLRSGIAPVDVPNEPPSAMDYLRSARPPEDEVASLIEYVDGSAGKLRHTAFATRMKRRLRSKDYFGAIYGDEPLPCPDGRDNGILRAVSSLVRTVMDTEPGSSPRHVFALLMRAVTRLEDDEQEPDKSWLDVLWEKTERMWAIEAGKRNYQAAEEMSFTERIVDGYRQAMLEQGIDIDEAAKKAGFEAVLDYVQRNSIATNGRFHYVLLPSGRFSDQPSTSPTLVADIHAASMSTFYPLFEVSPTGAERQRSPQSLIDVCGVSFQRIDGIVGALHSRIVHRSPVERVLEIPLYRLNEELLEFAEPNGQVAEWLAKAFGNQADRVEEWIAHSLDFHHGICALSIIGPPNTGKTLFAEILARCLHNPRKNDGRVFGRFNAALMQSPIVHVDEGVESMTGGAGRSFDETFRAMTTGGQMTLEEKNQPTVTACLYPRLILTANGVNIIEALVGRRDLSADSRAALEERVLMVRARSMAQTFFRDRGTAWVTQHFFGNDMAAPRHFMWLYQNRKKPSGRRLLVEGDSGTEVFYDLSLATPVAQAIVRAICEMVQRGHVDGMIIDGRKLSMSVAAIVRWIENQPYNPHTTVREVGTVLQQTELAHKGTWKTAGPEKVVMHDINALTLVRMGTLYGLDVTKMAAIARAADPFCLGSQVETSCDQTEGKSSVA